jgi:DNA ligase (NAD+)
MSSEQTLQSKIDQYLQFKDAYYSGEPLITDDEFDEFEQELIDLGYDPIVGTVAEPAIERKASHRNMMLSLGKKKVYGDEMPIEMAKDLFDRFGPGELSMKEDGMAIEAQYNSGILGLIVTRGNGEIGTNQTQKLKHLFPEKLSRPIDIDIRCELVMNQKIFDTKYSIQSGGRYKHSRNLVAGISNDIDPDDVRKWDLDIVVLEAISNGNVVNPSEFHQIFLEKYKTNETCFSAEDIKLAFDEFHKIRSVHNFGTDGAVYSSLESKFTHNGHHPDYAISIKFAPPSLTSKITDIKWNLNKTGRVTPVIYFDPIEVDGRTIQRASGHNLAHLVRNDFRKGAKVNIVLSNDIIAMVTKI